MNLCADIVGQMDPTTSLQPHELVSLYSAPEVNRITGYGPATARLDARDLAALYTDLCTSAPRRHRRGKQYFEGRSGITSSGQYSNRREEHLAVALRNAFSDNLPLQLPDGRTLRILDYQTPLKARRDDKGIGKIDLFGVISDSLPCVIELKVPTASGGCSDTPLRAFLEAFAYCAIVEANIGEIAAEAAKKLSCDIPRHRPALMIMAPEDYWLSYLSHPKAGVWWPLLQNLADELANILRLETHFIALRDAGFEMGLEGKPPRLLGSCLPVSVADLAKVWENSGDSSTARALSPQ